MCQIGRQGVGVHLSPKTKTVSCCFYHRLVALNGLPKRLQRDGLEKKAGDEIRTRDSLLGRQIVTISTHACYEMALENFQHFLDLQKNELHPQWENESSPLILHQQRRRALFTQDYFVLSVAQS